MSVEDFVYFMSRTCLSKIRFHLEFIETEWSVGWFDGNWDSMVC